MLTQSQSQTIPPELQVSLDYLNSATTILSKRITQHGSFVVMMLWGALAIAELPGYPHGLSFIRLTMGTTVAAALILYAWLIRADYHKGLSLVTLSKGISDAFIVRGIDVLPTLLTMNAEEAHKRSGIYPLGAIVIGVLPYFIYILLCGLR